VDIIDHIGYYEVPLGVSGTIHICSEVVKIARWHERRWVDVTDAIVDDVQGVFFASERSITVEY